MIRLFVGIELPEPVVSALSMIRGGVDGAKWRSDEQVHLTLRFIGEVEPRFADEIRDLLHGVHFQPFQLQLSGVGIFGKPKRPRALWAGVQEAKPLKHLHEKIDNILTRLDLQPEERKFKPHVTLAHFRGRSDRVPSYLVDHTGFKAPAFTVEHFTLFRSHLGQEGARYQVEERYPALGTQPAHDGLDASDIGAAEEPYMHE